MALPLNFPEMKPLPENATEEERTLSFLEYARELSEMNPGHEKRIAEMALNAIAEKRIP